MCACARQLCRHRIVRCWDGLFWCALLQAWPTSAKGSGELNERIFPAQLYPVADHAGLQAFDELGSASYGRAGRVLIYSTVYIAIFGAPMLLHLTAAESKPACAAMQELSVTA